ncbi:MAG: aminotransferase class I/II-fold pyridoxal phosphate-dependent enzyme, partial [Rhodobacter sp.]|nr:aminotransferase class I/II-fold pyridoxal phosphate-dependent enzyme [Rhodobacter sp.]
ALNQGPALEAQVAAPFLRRRAIAAGVLNGANAVISVPCDGAMYVMLDIRATAMTGEAFANALLDAEKIAVMPGESFGRAAAGHLRVAMTVDDATFEDALRRLVAFAEARLAGKPAEISA